MTQAVKAVAKDVRMSPRKVGEVAALVRGRTVEDALVILEHTPRRAAKPVYKTVVSAAANAENNHKLDPKSLVIESIQIGQGFAMKRYRPAAHGRALPFKKMTSNITVLVSGSAKPAKVKSSTSKTKAKTTPKSATTTKSDKSNAKATAKKEEK